MMSMDIIRQSELQTANCKGESPFPPVSAHRPCIEWCVPSTQYPVTSPAVWPVHTGTGGTTGPAQSYGARGQVRRQRRGETPGCPTQEAVRDGVQVPVQPRSHGQRQPARHGQGQDGGVPHLQELSQVSVSCGDHNNNSQSGYLGEHLVILY